MSLRRIGLVRLGVQRPGARGGPAADRLRD